MSAHEQPTFDQILEEWMPNPDDRFDADAALDLAMADAAKNGDIVHMPLESMDRVREPLTWQNELFFGDFILPALRRTDLTDE